MTIEFSVVVAAIVALLEIAKGFKLDTKWCPLIAIALGIISNFGLKIAGATTFELAFVGVLMGLSAAGLYDVGKNQITSASKGITGGISKILKKS